MRVACVADNGDDWGDGCIKFGMGFGFGSDDVLAGDALILAAAKPQTEKDGIGISPIGHENPSVGRSVVTMDNVPSECTDWLPTGAQDHDDGGVRLGAVSTMDRQYGRGQCTRCKCRKVVVN